ncbi:MAG: arylesterase [Desulfonatronovibrio sp.]
MIKILALGDSLTAGYGLEPESSFAARLHQRLLDEGNSVQVINGGFSGDTTSDGLTRIKDLLTHMPELVIVQFGANDLYAGLPAGQVQTNLETMIDMCRNKDAEVILAGILCLVDQADAHSQDIHQAFEQAALSRNVRFLPDFMPGIPGNPGLTLPDGIHPNRAGVDAMVENILPLVRSMLSDL